MACDSKRLATFAFMSETCLRNAPLPVSAPQTRDANCPVAASLRARKARPAASCARPREATEAGQLTEKRLTASAHQHRKNRNDGGGKSFQSVSRALTVLCVPCGLQRYSRSSVPRQNETALRSWLSAERTLAQLMAGSCASNRSASSRTNRRRWRASDFYKPSPNEMLPTHRASRFQQPRI